MTSSLIHPEVAEEREEAVRGHGRLGFWGVRNQVQPLAKGGSGRLGHFLSSLTEHVTTALNLTCSHHVPLYAYHQNIHAS